MFTPRTLEFLTENHLRGSREWFAEHKGEYQELVVRPLHELTAALTPTAEAIDPLLVTDPKAVVSRIYRDMRFAKGGSPYRDLMWLSFRRDKQAYPCWPEIYVIVSPDVFFYGCGHYAARADVMDTIRHMILEKDPRFLRAKEALEDQQNFKLEGDRYKKSRFPDQPADLTNWLDRKSLCFSCRPPLTALFDEKLAEHMAENLKMIKPVYDFLIHAEGITVKTGTQK